MLEKRLGAPYLDGLGSLDDNSIEERNEALDALDGEGLRRNG